MLLLLPDEAATLALGRALAVSLPENGPYPALLLSGGLGAGKTTLARGLVSALPGAEAAEVASPSFNIVNYYPTFPPVAHFDLYRLEGLPPDEDLHDCLADPGVLVLVEWAQYLAPAHFTEDFLSLAWQDADQGRALDIQAHGPASRLLLAALGQAWKNESGQMPAQSARKD